MKKHPVSFLLILALLIGLIPLPAQATTMGQEIVDYAKEWIGTPYVTGGTNLSSGVDCSGFVCRVYEHFGINLWGRRTGLRKLTDDGVATELGTDLSIAQPGDIITCYDGGHVVIYAGNGRVVQSSSKHGVCESPATYAWLGNVISIIRINAVSSYLDPTVAADLGEDFYAWLHYAEGALNVSYTDEGIKTAYQDGADPRQVWHFVRSNNENSYHITNLFSNLALTANYSGGKSGTVTESSYGESNAQKWEFYHVPEKDPWLFTIKPTAYNVVCLDIYNTLTTPTNVQLYEAWDGPAQIFGYTIVPDDYLDAIMSNLAASKDPSEPTVATTPTPTSTPKPSSTPAPKPTPSLTPIPKPTPTPMPTPKPIPTPTPSPAPTSKPTPTSVPTPGPTTDLQPSGSLPLSATRSYAPDLFWDVKTDAWFYGNVADAYEMGLMNGTGASSFSPGNNMTLAEAVTLAARIHSLYHNGQESFKRYDGGSWYDPYVDYARENQIIDVNYDYSRPATREEFVHILARALPEAELANIAGPASFADSRDIVYHSDVALLSGAGVINGISENGQAYFKPTATITRAEVAAVVARMARPDSRIGK